MHQKDEDESSSPVILIKHFKYKSRQDWSPSISSMYSVWSVFKWKWSYSYLIVEMNDALMPARQMLSIQLCPVDGDKGFCPATFSLLSLCLRLDDATWRPIFIHVDHSCSQSQLSEERLKWSSEYVSSLLFFAAVTKVITIKVTDKSLLR